MSRNGTLTAGVGMVNLPLRAFALLGVLLVASCAPRLHTGMSRAEMTAALSDQIAVGMPEPAVLEGLRTLKLDPEIKSTTPGDRRPEITAIVMPRYRASLSIIPDNSGLLSIELSKDRSLLAVRYQGLIGSDTPPEWFPNEPVTLIGERP